MSSKSRVILVKCDSYSPRDIRNALNEIFELSDGNAFTYGRNILLKPNLCLPVNPDAHITTHPELLRQLIIAMNDKHNITVAETNIGNLNYFRREKVWEITGVNSVIQEFGIKKDYLNKNISSLSISVNGLNYAVPVSDLIFRNDIINVPKFKTHGLMGLTGCVKNMYGILAGDSKKLFHKIFPDVNDLAKFIRTLYTIVPIKYNIVDSVYCLEGDGPGASGTPKKLGLLIAGNDGFAIDRVLCVLMGIIPSNVPTNLADDYDCDDLSDIEILGEPIEKYIAKDFKLPEMTVQRRRIVSKMMSLNKGTVSVDNEKCKLCKMCLKNCPNSAISVESSKIKISKIDCISCLVCQETCLYGAIQVKTESLIKEMLHKKEVKI